MQEHMSACRTICGSGLAKSLGVSAGVPPRAADVNLGKLLRESHPLLADQVDDPACLLLKPEDFPAALPSVRSRLDRTYSQLVDRNVTAGLQDLGEEDDIAHFKGQPIVGAAFAVGKAGTTEDRMISAVVQTNALLDPRRLPRPRYAHVPRLRSGTVCKHVRLSVSKRDARHYFHRLRLGRGWRPFLAHPPVMRGGKVVSSTHLRGNGPCTFIGLGTSTHRPDDNGSATAQ